MRGDEEGSVLEIQDAERRLSKASNEITEIPYCAITGNGLKKGVSFSDKSVRARRRNSKPKRVSGSV